MFFPFTAGNSAWHTAGLAASSLKEWMPGLVLITPRARYSVLTTTSLQGADPRSQVWGMSWGHSWGVMEGAYPGTGRSSPSSQGDAGVLPFPLPDKSHV